MISFTTIVAVDDAHLNEFQLTWPTWARHRPEIMQSPLLIIADGASGDLNHWEERLAFVGHSNRRILIWNQDGVTQREKMLTALTLVSATAVETKWYLKLDTDTVAKYPSEWLQEEWFEPDESGREPAFVSSPWGYTKPAGAIDRLDAWADLEPSFSNTEALRIARSPEAGLVSHPRIISWCFFGRTDWTREVTACCEGRLPVPSQDTFLWYCAERRGNFYRRVRMKEFGWAHTSHPNRLRRLVEQAMLHTAEVQPEAMPSKIFSTSHLKSAARVQSPEGVAYLLTGTSHAARLVVSIASLRAHYQGPVVLFTTQPESHVLGETIASDDRLGISHRPIHPPYSGKNASYLSKIAILEMSPFERTVFLDADTIVNGSIQRLFKFENKAQIVATSFSGWRSNRKPVYSRIENWRKISVGEFLGLSWETLLDSAQNGHPAINTGVFSVRSDSEIVPVWRSLAEHGRQQFICDEIALQILLHHFPHQVLDERWNCSPQHGKSLEQAHIVHFHGDKHMSDRGRVLWWPRFQASLADNLGGIRDWAPAEDGSLSATSVQQPLVLHSNTNKEV